ncbi:MAG: hypothetical protein Q4G61_11025, partial [Tissierellia bacterium]|nr:hypothetical protein [Tissierellia bacterium]
DKSISLSQFHSSISDSYVSFVIHHFIVKLILMPGKYQEILGYGIVDEDILIKKNPYFLRAPFRKY